MFSESLSDARRSLKSSTDEILLPKIISNMSNDHDLEESNHWHSLPLALALLPAAGGMMFTNGSSVVTDLTLLVLAAIFMNWALRMPWDWYHAAQSAQEYAPDSPITSDTIEEEDESQVDDSTPSPQPQTPNRERPLGDRSIAEQDRLAAQNELRLHELMALLSCFAFPALAAWLLHAIRSQLSRPSEGLVSNYNLTIFLMVAEIRPLSHLIKLIQRRTLYLQRRVGLDRPLSRSGGDTSRTDDLAARIEELESHIASGIAETAPTTPKSPDELVVKASTEAVASVKKAVQPELDALGRAMRRYEKRSTISAVQVETRLQDLEARVKDVVVLAAAAQRSADQQPRHHFVTLVDWLSALVVVPVHFMMWLLTLPYQLLTSLLVLPRRYLPSLDRRRRPKDSKAARKLPKAQPQDREKKLRVSQQT